MLRHGSDQARVPILRELMRGLALQVAIPSHQYKRVLRLQADRSGENASFIPQIGRLGAHPGRLPESRKHLSQFLPQAAKRCDFLGIALSSPRHAVLVGFGLGVG
jgi:hypothetical protein